MSRSPSRPSSTRAWATSGRRSSRRWRPPRFPAWRWATATRSSACRAPWRTTTAGSRCWRRRRPGARPGPRRPSWRRPRPCSNNDTSLLSPNQDAGANAQQGAFNLGFGDITLGDKTTNTANGPGAVAISGDNRGDIVSGDGAVLGNGNSVNNGNIHTGAGSNMTVGYDNSYSQGNTEAGHDVVTTHDGTVVQTSGQGNTSSEGNSDWNAVHGNQTTTSIDGAGNSSGVDNTHNVDTTHTHHDIGGRQLGARQFVAVSTTNQYARQLGSRQRRSLKRLVVQRVRARQPVDVRPDARRLDARHHHGDAPEHPRHTPGFLIACLQWFRTGPRCAAVVPADAQLDAHRVAGVLVAGAVPGPERRTGPAHPSCLPRATSLENLGARGLLERSPRGPAVTPSCPRTTRWVTERTCV